MSKIKYISKLKTANESENQDFHYHFDLFLILYSFLGKKFRHQFSTLKMIAAINKVFS